MTETHSLSRADQSAAVDVMNRMVKPALNAIGQAVIHACEAEGQSPVVAMTAMSGEALLLAAIMHDGAGGTVDSFLQMARTAIEHAVDLSCAQKASAH